MKQIGEEKKRMEMKEIVFKGKRYKKNTIGTKEQ
jgi:hypothetical protein